MGEQRGDNLRILLLVAQIAAVVALPGFDDSTGLNLSCTNDFSGRISCDVDGQNCSELQLTVRSVNWADEKTCSFQQSDVGRCCCSVEMLLIVGDAHTATVWRDGKNMESKQFNVKESMKPKTPKIISVKESNGNFEVMWEWNMEGIAKNSLTAEVTYNTSDMKKVQVPVTQIKVDGLGYHKIPGRHLKSSENYTVSVRSITDWSGRMSDSSNEFQFKTPASFDSVLLAITISLSVAAVILSGTTYVCFDRLKSKWWDPVTKYPNPKLVVPHSSKQEVLRLAPPVISSISVDPIDTDDSKKWSKTSVLDLSGGSLQPSSGISTGSSGVSYANTEPTTNIIASVQDALCKLFPNITPISQPTSFLKERNVDCDSLWTPTDPCGDPTSEMSFGSSGLFNKTYSVLFPHQNEENSPDVLMQTEMLCESTYRCNERDVLDDQRQQASVLPFPAHQDFLFPSGVSAFVGTDMSYQPCNAESGTFSEESTFSSLSSDTNTTMSSDLEAVDDAGRGIVDGVVSRATKPNSFDEGAVITNTNLCNSSAPAESQSGLIVDDGYQPIQNLVGKLDVRHLETTFLRPEEPLDRQKDELLTKIPQNVFGPTDPGLVNHDQRRQTDLLLCLPADRLRSVIVDSDYQAV